MPDFPPTSGGSSSGSSSNSGSGNNGDGNTSGGTTTDNGSNSGGPPPLDAFDKDGNKGNPFAGGSNGRPNRPPVAANTPAPNTSPPLTNFDEPNWRQPPVSELPAGDPPRAGNPRARAAADGVDFEPPGAAHGEGPSRKATVTRVAADEPKKKEGGPDPRRGNAGGAADMADEGAGDGGAVSWRYLLRWLLWILLVLLLLYLIVGELKRRNG
jgi:hypothetical protein